MLSAHYVLVDYGSYRARSPDRANTQGTLTQLRKAISTVLDALSASPSIVRVRLYHGFIDEQGKPSRESTSIAAAIGSLGSSYSARVYDWTTVHSPIACPGYRPPTLVMESACRPGIQTAPSLSCTDAACGLKQLSATLSTGACPTASCARTTDALVREKQGPVDALLQADLLSIAFGAKISTTESVVGVLVITQDRDLIPAVATAHSIAGIPIQLALPNMKATTLERNHPGVSKLSLNIHTLSRT